MKRILKSFLSALSLLLLFPKSAFAANLCPDSFANLCKLRAEDGGGIVGTITTFLFIVAIVLALVYLVYGGIKYITSGGDKAKVDAARHHLTAAIIGLVIALLAYGIINLISLVFTGSSFTEVRIPRLVGN